MKNCTLCLLVIHCVLYTISLADDCAIGLSLIGSGRFDEAREYIKRAYSSNPSSARIQYAYARISPNGEEARSIYTKIAENESAKDSLRAEACFQLGCFFYSLERYDSAQAMFTKAEKFFAKEEFSHMKALAANNRGDTPAAEAVWMAMVSRESKGDRARAQYYLGNMFYRQGKYEEAFNCYTGASEAKESGWSAAALSGACLSAYNSGNTRRGDQIHEQIRSEYPSFLESDMVEGIINGLSFAEADSTSRKDISGGESFSLEKEENGSQKKNEKGTYALQIGAFTSKDNAKRLYNEIKRDFKNAIIKEETVNKKTFYRVRVGNFRDEKEALEFGEKELKTKGVNFRVVKE